MTVIYPDIASYQGNISLAGFPAVCIKATEDGGEGPTSRYVNPFYQAKMAEARRLGIPAIAYHYLHGVDPAAEADFCLSVAGLGVPLMLDVEAYGADVADCLAFTREARARGGNPRLCYLPRWYWTQIGSPDLRPLAPAGGLALVSSYYGGDWTRPDWPGWQPYAPGQPAPAIGQYTDRGAANGQAVDLNVFRGTIDQFRELLGGDMTALDDAFPAAPGVVDAAGHPVQRTLTVDIREAASILLDGKTIGGDAPAGLYGIVRQVIAEELAHVIPNGMIGVDLAGALVPHLPTAEQIAAALIRQLTGTTSPAPSGTV